MKPWQKWALHALTVVVTASGLGFLWTKYFVEPSDPFAVVNHPWQPYLLNVHVLTAPALILIFGIVFQAHVDQKLRAGAAPNRPTGLVSLATFAVMVASGYLLQVLSGEAAARTLLILHLASGVLFALTYSVHLFGRAPAIVLGLIGVAVWASAQTAEQPISRGVVLMGTRAQLSTYDPDRAAGLGRLDRFVRSLEATEAELSTWRRDSALAVLNRQPASSPLRVEPSLCELLAALASWTTETGGAFDPGIGALVAAYDLRGSGRLPTAGELGAARRRSGMRLLKMERASCLVRRTGGVTIEEGGFGKGEALDRVRTLREADASSWLIDLGGQVAVGGAPPGRDAWIVDLADPRARDRQAASIRLRAGSLSISGGSERDLWVDHRRIGHILDPRTGEPAPFAGSVAVWHERALVADVLSTALYVMGPDAGLKWADKRDIAACFLIPDARSVELRSSRAFIAQFGAL